MRIDVLFGPWQLTPAFSVGRVVAVIDVLRASTTIAAAMANGAKNIVPAESADDAITRSKAFERNHVLLAGERKMLTIPGFDLGNSPLDFSRDAVEGKTVLLTTTNGTPALTAVQGARDVVVASYVNFSAVSALLRTALRGDTDVTLLCSGRDRQFSIEDAACAGRFAAAVGKYVEEARWNDGALAARLIDRRYEERLDRLFADSEHGQALLGAGFAEDLEMCATLDAYPVIPIYQERLITKLGPDRER